MNRIDRVTAILIQLQSKRIVKAQEIADRFSISLRTVYRDIKTLEEAGIPIIGESGIGYSLMEGYRLPPVMFSREEATAFLTAEKLVDKLTDQSTRKAYQTALFKIKSVLRVSERDHIENLESFIEVIDNPYLSKQKPENAYLQILLQGIAGKLTLSIDYYSEHNLQHTTRNIEPVGIFFMSRYWYLIAWCTLRKDYRTFRTDNIRKLILTEKPFQKTHPSLQTFLSKFSKEKELHTIILLVEKNVVRFLGEQKYYNGFISQKEMGDQIEMTFLTESLEGFARWFLLFGEWAEILTPDSLKGLVRNQLKKLSEKIK